MTARMTAAWASAAALLATGTWIAVEAQGPPMAATIVLTNSSAGCVKTLVGNDPAVKDQIRAKRGNVVQWTVSNNNCTGSVAVSVQDFVRKSDGQPLSPFANPNLTCSAAPGRTCMITGAVTSTAQQTTYSYATYIGGKKIDPDLIIDP